MTSLGKAIRMRRLFNRESGKILVIALDHGIAWGVLPGIEHIGSLMEEVISAKPDAVTMHKGVAEKLFYRYAGEVALILKTTSFAPYHPDYDAWLTQVDEAVRLGADAIAVGATVGGGHQAELVRNLAALTREAALAGMPTVCHIYPKGNLIPKEERYAVRNVSYAARVAAEVGVDVVKTFYTGSRETFRKVVESCPAKVVVSGGPKLPTSRDVFQMTRDAMEAGAAGVTYGRNVWQAKDPISMIRALKHLVHEEGTLEEALEIIGE